MDFRPIDADNHYYEPLDAFTRHLPKEFARRGVRAVQSGKRVELLIAERVNRFVPNPTFDPIIVPGCLDQFFRGQRPGGADRSRLMKVEPLRIEYVVQSRGSGARYVGAIAVADRSSARITELSTKLLAW